MSFEFFGHALISPGSLRVFCVPAASIRSPSSFCLPRLWCIFELAAYRRANPNGKIVFAPVFVELTAYMLWSSFALLVVMLWASLASQLFNNLVTAVWLLTILPLSVQRRPAAQLGPFSVRGTV